MPCGGIYPYSPLDRGRPVEEPSHTGECWVCGLDGAQHFCDEWDTFIHAVCVPAFLATPEGQVVIGHGHEIYLKFDVESEKVVTNTAYKGGGDLRHAKD